MIGLIGIIALLSIAVLFSENRKAINVSAAIKTLLLQISIAIFALATHVGETVLNSLKNIVETGISYGNVGIEYMFGSLAMPENGYVLAFQVFPIVIFIAALFSFLFHIRIMDVFIKIIGGAIHYITGASRLESTCAAANIFIGMTEAPLVILPYLKSITRAQLFVVMALGLSSVAGTVLVAYASMGVPIKMLLTASFMAAPGGLVMARILVPETSTPFDINDVHELEQQVSPRAGNVIEAISDGALIGLQIFLSIIAVLLAFVAFIALFNGVLGGIGGWFGYPNITMELILGYLFAPIAFLIGIPWEECLEAGTYLGQKVILNEFVAYGNFAPNLENFSTRAQMVITIALCGFANFSGLAILIAGLSSVIPERKSEISALGFKAVLAGTLSNFTSAAIVCVVLSIVAIF